MSEARIRHGHRDVNSDKAEAEAEAQIRISGCDAQGSVAYVASRLKTRLRDGCSFVRTAATIVSVGSPNRREAIGRT